MDECFHSAGLRLIGIQEARKFPGERSTTRHFTRFASPGDNGQFGCQLWISKASSPVCVEGNAGRFRPEKAVIVHREPRILAVVVPVAGRALGIIVGHAPTSAATAEARAGWWAEVDAVVRKLPRAATPLLLLDANARFEAHAESPSLGGSTPSNHNAQCLQPLASEHGLDSTSLFLPNGQRVVTWTAPSGHESQLDYVLAPRELVACSETVGVPEGFVDHTGFDHRPMAARFAWRDLAKAEPPGVRFDTQAMRSEAGRLRLKAIFQSVPPVPWAVHPDAHVHHLNSFLFSQLSTHFPMPAARSRQPHVSEAQWTAIRCRRHARRLLQRVKRQKHRYGLACFFAGWRAQCGQAEGMGNARLHAGRRNRAGFTEARLAVVIRSVTSCIRRLTHIDAAAHARDAMTAARRSGPTALAALLRGVMKTGRRYRAPRVQHVIEADGQVLADAASIEAALERHFSVPEHGRGVAVPSLICTDYATCREDIVGIDALPSVADLAVGLQRLKHGKAPGASLLPAEAFSQTPLEAAMAIYPLFAKGAIRRQVPVLWRGTQAVALLKPAKPSRCLSSWRNIVLFDCCSK